MSESVCVRERGREGGREGERERERESLDNLQSERMIICSLQAAVRIK